MKAKKSLGQNFFVNKNLKNHIVNKVLENETKSVVEIGPGLGSFTEDLVANFEHVIVVEKDIALANDLKLRFPKIEVITGDFLDLDLNIFKEKDFTYFGSLPYNVSKPIIRKIIEHKTFTNKAFFIIQKEVAEKYIYKKPYNILSLTTAIYADFNKYFDISPDSFRPKPNVNSSFVSFTPNDMNIKNIENLEQLIHHAFKQPRKNLKNNLRNSVYFDLIGKFFNLRPAELSLNEYIEILNNHRLH